MLGFMGFIMPPMQQGRLPFPSSTLGVVSAGDGAGPLASFVCPSIGCRSHRRLCSSRRCWGADRQECCGVGCGGWHRPAVPRGLATEDFVPRLAASSPLRREPPLARMTSSATQKRRRKRSRREWLPLMSSPTPPPVGSGYSTADGGDSSDARGDGDSAAGSDERTAGETFESRTPERPRRVSGWGAGDDVAKLPPHEVTADGSSDSRSRSSRRSSEGRIRLKLGVDLDIPVPKALEDLVKGPWDPQGDIWRRQLDLAAQVIARSGGVVFMEQLAPVLNPREGPPEWYRERAVAGGGYGSKGAEGGVSTEVVGGEALMLRLLLELNGVPEVTAEGDILYVFPGFAGEEKARHGRTGKGQTFGARGDYQQRGRDEEDATATPEVLQFEEVPRLWDTLPKMLPDQGPKVIQEFFRRTTFAGFALFMSMCLVLGQLIFGSWPPWLAAGPAYLVWVGLDDTLRRSRNASARQRDRWRGQWADVCRGDGDAIWRKRVAARSRARSFSDGM